MAFIKSGVTLPTGITLEKRHTSEWKMWRSTQKRDMLYCVFNLYASEQARMDGKERIETYYRLHIPCDKTGNLVQQAYEYVNAQLESEDGDIQLKNLFSGVVSV